MMSQKLSSQFGNYMYFCTCQQGGLGGLKYPLLSDFTKTVATDYGVLIEQSGVALR